MKIVEACEEKDELKIKTEESEKIEEESDQAKFTKKGSFKIKPDINSDDSVTLKDLIDTLSNLLKKYPDLSTAAVRFENDEIGSEINTWKLEYYDSHKDPNSEIDPDWKMNYSTITLGYVYRP